MTLFLKPESPPPSRGRVREGVEGLSKLLPSLPAREKGLNTVYIGYFTHD